MAFDITYNIEKQIGVISEGKDGWKMELNLVSWNNRDAKFDIRSWDAEHQKMTKGVTLTRDELAQLKNLIDQALA